MWPVMGFDRVSYSRKTAANFLFLVPLCLCRLVDNFCVCEGFSVPRCLMYEIYVETCGQSAQNQVNPATFGKVSTETLVHADVLFCKLQPPRGGA